MKVHVVFGSLLKENIILFFCSKTGTLYGFFTSLYDINRV